MVVEVSSRKEETTNAATPPANYGDTVPSRTIATVDGRLTSNALALSRSASSPGDASIFPPTSNDDTLLELAVSLAERFAPILTVIALARTAVIPAETARFTGKAAATVGNFKGLNGQAIVGTGVAADVGSTTIPTAAGGGATATGATATANAAPPGIGSTNRSSPTALTCFAAECALAMTAAAANVASLPLPLRLPLPPPLPLPSSTTSPPKLQSQITRLSGNSIAEAAATEVPASPAEGRQGTTMTATGASKGAGEGARAGALPIIAHVDERGGGETPLSAAAAATAVAAGFVEKERRRALRLLASLAPSSTVPLLLLSEAWVGGRGSGGNARAEEQKTQPQQCLHFGTNVAGRAGHGLLSASGSGGSAGVGGSSVSVRGGGSGGGDGDGNGGYGPGEDLGLRELEQRLLPSNHRGPTSFLSFRSGELASPAAAVFEFSFFEKLFISQRGYWFGSFMEGGMLEGGEGISDVVPGILLCC